MTTDILFIQGAGEGAHEEDSKLVASLRAELGAEYKVRYPKMPDEGDPQAAPWTNRIAEEIAAFSGKVVLVGHSLGGPVVLKHLSDATEFTSIAGLIFIAPPFFGAGGWEGEDLELPDGFAAELPADLPVFFYHSRDDEWVPFAHLALYRKAIPQATFREFDGRGHQFKNDLTEVGRDIKSAIDDSCAALVDA